MTSVQSTRAPAAHARTLRAALRARLAVAAGITMVAAAGLPWAAERRVLPLGLLLVTLAAASTAAVSARTTRLNAGIRAERRAARILERIPGAVVLHGLPAAHGDIDHVVACGRLLAVETKHGRGVVALGRSGELTVNGRGLPRDAVRQARQHAAEVTRRTGLPCRAVVAFSDTTSRPFTTNGVTVCSLRDLSRVIAALPADLTSGQAASALRALTTR